MNPDPTVTISCDYFVELSDDGMQSDRPEPEVIMPPPSSHITDPAPARPAEQGPQP
jgi:hypothetical protein